MWMRYPKQTNDKWNYGTVFIKGRGYGNTVVVHVGRPKGVRLSPPNTVRYRLSGKEALNHTDATLFDNQWRHYVFHKSGNTISTYINGVMVASRQVTVLNTNNTSQAVIGANYDDRANINFTGAIDEIRIYNRALSAKEVRALYDLEKPKVQ